MVIVCGSGGAAVINLASAPLSDTHIQIQIHVHTHIPIDTDKGVRWGTV